MNDLNEYEVIVEEVLTHRVKVKVPSEEEAINLIKNRYDNCELVLSADNSTVDTSFKAYNSSLNKTR